MEYTVDMENEYTIFFYNCKPDSKVSFELDIELFNIYRGTKNYLSGLFTVLSRFCPRRRCQTIACPCLPASRPTVVSSSRK